MAADDDGADDHAYSGHTLAATVMSTVSYISHDAGACLKSHISYIATYACTIAMPASVPTRVRSAIPFACFRAVCRVSCMDFAAGDGPLGTLRKLLRRLEVIVDDSTGARAVTAPPPCGARERWTDRRSAALSALTAGSTSESIRLRMASAAAWANRWSARAGAPARTPRAPSTTPSARRTSIWSSSFSA